MSASVTDTPSEPTSSPGEATSLWGRVRANPNPVWLREMRQSARLTRTPIVLATVTIVTALVISAVGGIASTTTAPAGVGVGVFHTFFSLAFAVVSWVGPGVAAITIASERSGRTWEALVLTGLSTRRIARGKFLAALTYLGLYLVMLAPVGALPFLFGGVTATEVLAAFILLALISALSVGFGLSVSSALSSPGLATIVVLPTAVFLSMVAYFSCGVGLSFAANALWPSVLEGGPVWLPTAYVRADFGLEYVVYLLVIPLGSIGLFSWFFYEATIANLSGPTEDRVFGLKRWLCVATPAFTAMSIAAVGLIPKERWAGVVAALLCVFVFSVFALFLFAGDALEPSQRVRVHFARRRASALRRALGPGIGRTVVFLLGLQLGALCVLAAVGIAFELHHGTARGDYRIASILITAGYSAAFLTFLGGVTVWVRAQSPTGTGPRLFLLLALFLALVGPWLALAIAGVFRSDFDDLLFIASPSPAYAFVMVAALESTRPTTNAILGAGLACMALWTLSGLLLLALGGRRIQTVLRTDQSNKELFEAQLRSEDAVLEAPREAEAKEP